MSSKELDTTQSSLSDVFWHVLAHSSPCFLGNVNVTILLQLSETDIQETTRNYEQFYLRLEGSEYKLSTILTHAISCAVENDENKVHRLFILWNYFILQVLIN